MNPSYYGWQGVVEVSQCLVPSSTNTMLGGCRTKNLSQTNIDKHVPSADTILSHQRATARSSPSSTDLEAQGAQLRDEEKEEEEEEDSD